MRREGGKEGGKEGGRKEREGKREGGKEEAVRRHKKEQKRETEEEMKQKKNDILRAAKNSDFVLIIGFLNPPLQVRTDICAINNLFGFWTRYKIGIY